MKKILMLSIGLLSACATSASEPTANEADVRLAESGFEYTCKHDAGMTVLDVPSTKLAITKSAARYENSYGPNVGKIDATYHAPKDTARVRYTGFETGEDCSLKLVVDEDLVAGKPSGKVRLQCVGDDFVQDVLSCSDPHPVTLSVDGAGAEAPAPAPATDGARKWSCVSNDDSFVIEERELSMQVTDAAIRVVGTFDKDQDYAGTRDRSYRPRSGNWIQYDSSDVWEGDVSFVVSGDALDANVKKTTLKVRLSGEDFMQNVYDCTTP